MYDFTHKLALLINIKLILIIFFYSLVDYATGSVSVLVLKRKFSSGIEGTLASTLNHNFNWKQLSEMILCISLLMFESLFE